MPGNVPKWPQTQADEPTFKAFVFAELDRRIAAETAMMAEEVQQPENIEWLLEMLAAGWSPPAPLRRGRGRPKQDDAFRSTLPSESAARLAVVIRRIFHAYWGRRNLTRPSPEDMAAEYVGIDPKLVRTRRKRAIARRPN